MRRLAVVMVAFLGCTTAKPAEEPAPVVVPRLAAPPASVSGELSLDLPAPPAPLPPLPRHPAGLEEPMAETPPMIGAACTEPNACGKSGKVALVATRSSLGHPGSPCKPVSTSRGHAVATSACLDGERVFVASSCIMCRTSSGEQLLGLVSDMTPAQLLRAQRLASLPEAPLLTTTAAWSSAIAAAARRTASL